MARLSSVFAVGALIATLGNVADAQTLLSAPQWTAKLYTSPPSQGTAISDTAGDSSTDEYIVYSYSQITGQYAFQDYSHGYVHTKVWSNGQKASWSNLDPNLVATADLTANLPEDQVNDAVVAELQAMLDSEAAPTFCSFKQEKPETISNVKFLYNEEGKAYYSYFDGTGEVEYVEDLETRQPLQIGDWYIGEFNFGVNPGVFQIHDNCYKDVQIQVPQYKEGELGAEGESEAPPPKCVKAPASSSWKPDSNELADEDFHSNGVKYDNNYSGAGGYSIPKNRLWGTVWCGYGNEFHVKARFKNRDCSKETNGERDKNKACKGKKDASLLAEKYGCIGAPILDNNEWKNDVYEKNEVSFRHHYPRHQYGCGNNCWKLQKKRKIDNHKWTFQVIMNSGAVPQSVSKYSIHTDGIQKGLGQYVQNFYDFSSLELPNSGPNAMGLSRCRAVANYIDTDYQKWNTGLTAGQWTDWGTSNTIDDWTGQDIGATRRHKDVEGERGATGWNSEDWCRQHDWCPLGQGETFLSCACDAAAMNLIARDPRAKHPFKGFPQTLFSDNSLIHSCFNLRLECFWGGLKCKDFRIHWEKQATRKYNPGNREDHKLWGPIARNDIDKETVCAKLRIKGEGIDGPHATPVPSIGDGICDCQYNNDLWGFDGGDCCIDTCTGAGCLKLKGSECAQPGCWTYSGGVKTKVGPWPVYSARYVDEACPGPNGQNVPCFEHKA